MVINPNCDMPEDIYKDFLADQGFDELRDINFANLVAGIYCSTCLGYHISNNAVGSPDRFSNRMDCDDVTHVSDYCLGSNFIGDAAYFLDVETEEFGDGNLVWWYTSNEIYQQSLANFS